MEKVPLAERRTPRPIEDATHGTTAKVLGIT
jgi:hypothetical protein